MVMCTAIKCTEIHSSMHLCQSYIGRKTAVPLFPVDWNTVPGRVGSPYRPTQGQRSSIHINERKELYGSSSSRFHHQLKNDKGAWLYLLFLYFYF